MNNNASDLQKYIFLSIFLPEFTINLNYKCMFLKNSSFAFFCFFSNVVLMLLCYLEPLEVLWFLSITNVLTLNVVQSSILVLMNKNIFNNHFMFKSQ